MAALLILLVASSTMLRGASAATVHQVAQADARSIASSDADAGKNGTDESGLPPFESGNDSATLVTGQTTVAKAKTTITLPKTLLRVYSNATFEQKGDFLNSTSPGWAVTNIGKHPRFGVFPDAKSTVLAFGAIPVTATIELRQLVVKHLLSPLVVTTSIETSPPFETRPTIVEGQVNLLVSDVMVDRVPLNVGSNCHTVRPLQLRLTGLFPRYQLYTGGPLNQTDLTIPAFAGCRNGTEDVSRVLTEMISGPNNALAMKQGYLGAWDTTVPGDCIDCDLVTPPQ